jgi:Tol biopolymer transport system component
VLLAASVVLWLLLRTPPAPKVLVIHQITHTGHPKGYRLGTDGAKVYFSDIVEAHGVPMAVSAGGGDAALIPMPLKDAWVRDVTPDGSELMVEVPTFDGLHSTAWHVPVLGGSPRRVGDLVVNDPRDTPDGRGILYVKGRDVYLANADGTGLRKLLSALDDAYGPYFSPDGSRLRFTVVAPGGITRGSIWEASPDGSNLHRFLPDWNPGGLEWGGSWTPNGKYFVFAAETGGNSNIWALREGGLFRGRGREPVQLTAGPMQLGPATSPLVSEDGKKIFFVGTQSNAELSVYDSRLHEFVPYLGGISAEGVSFSRDEQWVAYVRLPEGTLWRMKTDGTDQLQLTFPPMKVFMPRWSPDGKRIAFRDVPPNGRSKVYVIPLDGGTPEALTSGEHNEGDPTWSPDGNPLLFAYGGDSPDSSIRVLDLNTHQVMELPGSKGIYSPRWSPDGRYVAALTCCGDWKLMLFDFKTQKWEKLSELRAGFPNWSKDSRYVFFFVGGAAFYRVEIAGRKTEEVARFPDARMANGVPGFPWLGMTPNGMPLIAHGGGTEEIYALDVDFP